MKKTLATLGLAGTLILSSCDNNSTKTNSVVNKTSANIENAMDEKTKDSINATLPNKFSIKEDVISYGTDFTIPGAGKVLERTLNMTTTFELKNIKGVTIAKAKKELLSLGVVINIEDAKGHKIGSIEEQIIKSLLNIKTVYSIKDAEGNVVGTSKKLSFIGTDIDIYDNEGNEIVTCDRDIINLLSDTWKVNIEDDKIDKRIIAVIPCYKTVADNERKKDKEKRMKRRKMTKKVMINKDIDFLPL